MTTGGPVMIVDDDPDLRQMIALVVASQGYDTIEAADGLEALARIAEGVIPSLIILDLRMPRMNGTEFLAQLRRSPSSDRIPVVVISGDLGGARDAIAAGADACLPKPVEPRVLLASVRQHVDGTHAAGVL